MANRSQKILLVDDEEKFLNSLAERLRLLGLEPLKASSGTRALELARENHIDLAIVDYRMPDMDGLVTITKIKEISPDVRTVLLTGHGSEKVKQATEALNATYVEKDRLEDFWDLIRKSSKSGSVIVINPSSTDRPAEAGGGNYPVETSGRVSEAVPPGSKSPRNDPPVHVAGQKPVHADRSERLRMIGETVPMQDLRRNIERLAGLDCPVIIRGETGTGKELTARIIHNLSPRRQNRFMAVNCGCFSNDLLIEELFKAGKGSLPAETASAIAGIGSDAGGTILLDQIEDLSPTMQLSMLKIIDSKNVTPQEGKDNFLFDVRILAASRYNLRELVGEGKFREELYYRLNVMELYIPPLRERADDISPLGGYFLDRYAREFNKGVESIAEGVIRVFMAYDFPGNVRELEHIIERAVILADGPTVELRHLPRRFQTRALKPTAANSDRKLVPLAELEKQYIFEVLEATGGNKSRAVEILGISRAALWRKLKQFNERK